MSDEAPLAAVDPADYRRAMSRFATGVTVVTTRADGVDHAMTVNSLASVSLEPVLALFCVEKTARFHDAVLTAKAWAVSVLGADAADAAQWFATRGRPTAEQLAGFATVPGAVTGLVVFRDALAVIECRTWATYDGGDHTIVVGEVLAVDAAERLSPPLLYYDGDYYQTPG